MSEETYLVEWYEHKSIVEINDWVEKHFGKQTKDEYYQLSGICFEDFKVEAINWLDNKVAELENLKEMIEELPDDNYGEYEVDGNDNYVGVEDE